MKDNWVLILLMVIVGFIPTTVPNKEVGDKWKPYKKRELKLKNYRRIKTRKLK